MKDNYIKKQFDFRKKFEKENRIEKNNGEDRLSVKNSKLKLINDDSSQANIQENSMFMKANQSFVEKGLKSKISQIKSELNLDLNKNNSVNSNSNTIKEPNILNSINQNFTKDLNSSFNLQDLKDYASVLEKLSEEKFELTNTVNALQRILGQKEKLIREKEEQLRNSNIDENHEKIHSNCNNKISNQQEEINDLKNQLKRLYHVNENNEDLRNELSYDLINRSKTRGMIFSESSNKYFNSLDRQESTEKLNGFDMMRSKTISKNYLTRINYSSNTNLTIEDYEILIDQMVKENKEKVFAYNKLASEKEELMKVIDMCNEGTYENYVIADKIRTISELKEANNNLKLNLDQQVESVLKLTTDVEILNKNLILKEGLLNDLEKSLKKMKDELEKVYKLNKELEKEIQIMKSKEKSSILEIKDLVSRSKSEIDNLNSVINSKDNSISSLQNENKNLKRANNELIESKNFDNQNFQREIDSKNVEIKRLIEKEKSLNEEVNKLFITLEKQKITMTNFANLEKKYQDSITNLETEKNKILEEKIEEIKRNKVYSEESIKIKLLEYSEQIAELKHENIELLKKETILYKEILTLKSINDRLLNSKNRGNELKNSGNTTDVVSENDKWSKSVPNSNNNERIHIPSLDLEITNKYFQNKINNESIGLESNPESAKFQEDQKLIEINKQIVSNETYKKKEIKHQINHLGRSSIKKKRKLDDEIFLEESPEVVEINNKINLISKRSTKTIIKEGDKRIYAIYDSKRIISFNFEDSEFRVFDFIDNDNFAQNYEKQSTIMLNSKEDISHIITGKNSDILYEYSHIEKEMKIINNLQYNHYKGALAFNEKSNELICVSGHYNKSVEILNFNSGTKWEKLPNLSEERAETGIEIIDNFIYVFFGFNYVKMEFVGSIERLNLGRKIVWEKLKFKAESNSLRRSLCLGKLQQGTLLLIGGFNKDNQPEENIYSYEFKQNEIKTQRKLPYITNKNDLRFSKNAYIFENQKIMKEFTELNNNTRYICLFDDNLDVHVINNHNLQYDIFEPKI